MQPRIASDARIESGIEMQTINVLRQLPRNSRIIMPVRQAAMMRLAHHARYRALYEHRLIEQLARPSVPAADPARIFGSSFFTPFDHVQRGGLAVAHDREQCAAVPLVRTMLVCTE